jgi:phospholipase/carboxylesterase
MSSGIHHITLITRKVQANVDFYVGFLGLRLVKRTGGYEDPGQLHLFYGDRTGTPGSLITFLVWEDGSPGRAGHGQIGDVALAIDPGSLGFWLARTLRFHVPASGPATEFGEPVLRLRDPDSVTVKLVGSSLSAGERWVSADIPAEHAIRRIRGATILSEMPEETEAFIKLYSGFSPQKSEDSVTRLVSPSGDVIDIRDAHGFWPGSPGTGIADHIAFRAPDVAKLRATEKTLAQFNASLTRLHDRKYFTSLYVREPGGTLIEFATDGPGFTIDEPVESLGSRLFGPADAGPAEDIETVLPQFALPGEARVIYRELPFIHRFHTPEAPDGTTIVLLHGTGGNETDLMPLARRVAPHATLLGVRGRSTEEGILRWFRRLTPTSFDQADIRFEAEAFVAFIAQAVTAYHLAADRLVFLGYSNGANLLAALMLLHPGPVARAILLRPVMVLDTAPQADLSRSRVLMLSGRSDPYRALTPALEQALRKAGAETDARIVEAGHELTEADQDFIRNWLNH